MKLSDFDFCGFASMSRVIFVRDLAEAKKLSRFLSNEDFIKNFNEHGPGKYYVRVTEGWDRGGDYAVRDIVFIPEVALTWEETVNQLKVLNKIKKKSNDPFCIAQELQHSARALGQTYEEAYAAMTPKNQKIYDSMDVDANESASNNLENFLNGYD